MGSGGQRSRSRVTESEASLVEQVFQWIYKPSGTHRRRGIQGQVELVTLSVYRLQVLQKTTTTTTFYVLFILSVSTAFLSYAIIVMAHFLPEYIPSYVIKTSMRVTRFSFHWKPRQFCAFYELAAAGMRRGAVRNAALYRESAAWELKSIQVRFTCTSYYVSAVPK